MVFSKSLLRVGFLIAAIAYSFSLISAQVPDPRDSIIIESKFVPTSIQGACASAEFRIRVYITNKDTLGNVTLPLESRTIPGSTVYPTLSRPANCGPRTTSAVFNFLYPLAASGTPRLPIRPSNFDGYHSDSPDTFMWVGCSNAVDDSTKLPPNLPHTLLLEIKFDSVTGIGLFEIDSGRVLSNSVHFISSLGSFVPVNFIKGVDTLIFGDSFITVPVEENRKSNFPSKYHLSQNYPNPFNANTQIVFALPKAGHTTLEIFNVLGQKVSTLVDEYLKAGTKTVNWDGRDDKGTPVPSGIYFYQLRSGEFVEKKKMVFLK